jgi:hypothetical protein
MRVNAADLLIVRDYATGAANRLILLSLPAPLQSEGEAGGSQQKAALPIGIESGLNTFASKRQKQAANTLAEPPRAVSAESEDDRLDLHLAAYAAGLAHSENDTDTKFDEPTDLALLEYLDEF